MDRSKRQAVMSSDKPSSSGQAYDEKIYEKTSDYHEFDEKVSDYHEYYEKATDIYDNISKKELLEIVTYCGFNGISILHYFAETNNLAII